MENGATNPFIEKGISCSIKKEGITVLLPKIEILNDVFVMIMTSILIKNYSVW